MAPELQTVTDAMAQAFSNDPVARAWLEGYATGKAQASIENNKEN